MTNEQQNPILLRLAEAIGAEKIRPAEARNLGDFMMQAAPEMVPLGVALPRSTEDVAAILRLCQAAKVPVVAQGGMTGLAGGGTPVAGCILVSLEKLDTMGAVDKAGATITVGAGVPLQKIQQAADDAGMLFPLDLGARGSCQIGGNISTNAGGNRVLRYGMARELVLGIEAVLMDGTVMSSLNTMLKNNAGYDLKQLFIGSEGTLGVVTRAVLRLHPKPVSTCTALCAVAGYDELLALLQLARARLGGELAAFEMMWPHFYRLATDGLGRKPPLPHGGYGHVLVESMGLDQATDQARFEDFVAAAIESGAVSDAVIAQNLTQSREIWSIRDSSGEFRRTFWPHAGFDVSIPVTEIGAFVAECERRLRARWPEAEVVWFGHVADSNIHIGVKVGEGVQPTAEINALVYATTGEWKGSVSAEHGIGLLKKDYLHLSRSAVEIAMMRKLKAAFDPDNLLNPGKVI